MRYLGGQGGKFKKFRRIPKLCMGSLVAKIEGLQPTTKNRGPPLPPHYEQKGGSETLDMTSEGLGEMFEGESADICAAHVDGEPSRGSSVRRPGSEDPHRR